MALCTQDREVLDQGSIIYGVRSEKYPDVHCYGILITASCDCAQCKVSKLYYLTAVDAQEWFCTEVGYELAYRNKIKAKRQPLDSIAKKHGLDSSALLELTEEEVNIVLNTEINNQNVRQRIKDCYIEAAKYLPINTSKIFRKNVFNEAQKEVSGLLSKIGKGEVVHYYFLPQDAYMGNGVKNKGLMVDFQEIEIMPLKDASKLEKPGIDYLVLFRETEEERKRLKGRFWLESDSDFVAIEGKIQSPWREHMMQRFSYAFTRIGLDGATEDDYLELAKGI